MMGRHRKKIDIDARTFTFNISLYKSIKEIIDSLIGLKNFWDKTKTFNYRTDVLKAILDHYFPSEIEFSDQLNSFIKTKYTPNFFDIMKKGRANDCTLSWKPISMRAAGTAASMP